MKKMLSVFVSMGLVFSVLAQNKYAVEGVVKSEKNEVIEFATVLLLTEDSTQIAGAVSDIKGAFTMSAPKGVYQLVVHYLGYENHVQSMNISKSVNVGAITLRPSSVAVESVVVKTQFIKREADRFVVNVSGNPTAIGKDALEMLKTAPGVWVKEDDIMINGKSGSRVMVNDRLLNMSSDELNFYLKSIKAEDILKIEVIPMSGADMDADTQSGVIKITLKHQRNNGIEGSVGTSYSVGNDLYYLSPNFNINYRQDKLSLYANANYNKGKSYYGINEDVLYTDANQRMISTGVMDEWTDYYGGKLGVIYDISSTQSVGAEVNMGDKRSDSKSHSLSSMQSDKMINNVSDYTKTDMNKRLSATINYILKLDTLGSSFKVIGDFNSRKTDATNDYLNTATELGQASGIDTIYRSISPSNYQVYSITANLELRLNDKFKLKTGAKYNYNRMDNSTLYEGMMNDRWITDEIRSGDDNYSERIAAIYGIIDAKLKWMSFSAGLRAEYTNATPRSDKNVDMNIAKQNYLSLFPNLNISIPLNKAQSNSLILAYSRKISRPGFWALNPFRMQLSEYSYITGNPRLKPTFNNDFSFTGVLAYKYTISLGANLITDVMRQMVRPDADNPMILVYRHENLPQEWNYYVTANVPVNIAQWWTLNANFTGLRQVVDFNNTTRYNNALMANGSTTITLPKDFFVELGYYYVSSMMSGNMRVKSMHNLNASLKKRFAKGKVTASVGVKNILTPKGEINLYIDDTSYDKTTSMTQAWGATQLEFSLRYNFKSGISFKAKSVESGSDDESSRMNGK